MPPPNAPKPKAAPDNRRESPEVFGTAGNCQGLPGIARNAAVGGAIWEPPPRTAVRKPHPHATAPRLPPGPRLPRPRRYRKKFFIRSKMFCSLTGAACWNEGEAASFSTSFFSSEVSLSGIVMSTTTSSSPRP